MILQSSYLKLHSTFLLSRQVIGRFYHFPIVVVFSPYLESYYLNKCRTV